MEVSKHTPGTFCWFELGTSDQQAAKNFYSELFGWSVNDVPIGPDSFYSMMQLRGKDVAALSQLAQEQLAQGVPPHWLLYVAVESADEAAKAVNAAGGKTLMDPFDVFDSGRMTVAQDPSGATFGIWQARNHIGARIINEANTFCWGELATRDAAASSAFYGKVFGWKVKTGDPAYAEIHLDGQPFGGMLTMTAEMEGVPPHWSPYFAVDDCDALVEKAKSLGANTCVPPQDIPNVGRFAVLADPQGAVFSIIKLNYPA
ncbi:MAG: putative glyoxylase CFP32 [Acidobacteria bacterium]|nr:putative glyoxylase CFP32 [Acidobacteriota bacterium]